MRLRQLLFVLSVSAGLVTACSGSKPTDRVCDPGATQRCVCLVGSGVQTCADDGARWDTCLCAGEDAGVAQDAGLADAGSDAGSSAVTVAQIAQGQVTSGTVVRLAGVVVTSQQFLNRRNSVTNSCEWGLFVSAPSLAAAEPHSGLFVSGFGSPATVPDGGTMAYCPALGSSTTGSPFPDNTQPGDVLTLTGTVAQYLPPSSCADSDTSQVPQWRLTNVTSAQKTGTAAVPAPAVLSGADLAALASPTDATFHGKWSGVRVRLQNVSAALPTNAEPCTTTGTSFVGTFGIITLTPSGLRVGERLFWRSGLGQVCHAAPQFCGTDSTFDFSVVQGLHHLDSCTWTLQPNDKCADFTPRSADCSSNSCAPY